MERGLDDLEFLSQETIESKTKSFKRFIVEIHFYVTLLACMCECTDLESEVGGVVGERSYEDLLQGIEEECEKLRE